MIDSPSTVGTFSPLGLTLSTHLTSFFLFFSHSSPPPFKYQFKQEADKDNSGALSFDEISVLMSRLHCGIDTDEMRMVIAEADEDGNGEINYEGESER